jgi:DNA repair exonuclease SbcCD nuclease subunit
MRFLHAADIHLDAQLGLSTRCGAPPEAYGRATRDALRNLVDLALSQGVQFVVVAGDLFDTEASDASSFHFAATQFQRLDREQIPVYLIRGNHDSLEEKSQRLAWPSNVHQFRADGPETKFLPELNVAIHGRSFPARKIPEDLTVDYPDAVDGAFNIGLLHTSLSGNVGHDTYAPTDIGQLRLKGYQYWALGHVHSYQRISEDGPAIVYSGCTQGRSIRETGPRGCAVVTVEDGVPAVEFHATDAVRWALASVDLQPDDDREALIDRTTSLLSELRQTSAGRPLAVRVLLNGRCAAHHWIVSEASADDLWRQVDLAGKAAGEDLWIECVVPRTTPPVDLEALRSAPDLLGEMLRDLAALRDGASDELLELAEKALRPLREKAGAELSSELCLTDPALLEAWVAQSEGLILDALSESEAMQ